MFLLRRIYTALFGESICAYACVSFQQVPTGSPRKTGHVSHQGDVKRTGRGVLKPPNYALGFILNSTPVWDVGFGASLWPRGKV